MSARKRTEPKPAGGETAGPAPADASTAEQTTDYKRAGGHVLTDFGWVPESLVGRVKKLEE